MKKIVYIISDISSFGGREKITLDKALELSKKNQVYIISYKIDNKKIIQKYPDIIFINLNFSEVFEININGIKKFLYSKKLLKRLNSEVKVIKPDIIIGLMDFGFSEYFKIKTLGKKIIEIHGSYEYYYNKYCNHIHKNFFKKLRGKIYFYILKKIFEKYDTVIILSEIDKEKWNFENIEVIPNFYENNKAIELRNSFNEKRFISAGRLSYEKGYDILIEVWKKVIETRPDIKIDIFGEGSEESKIKELIKKYKLENNIFLNKFTDQLQEKYKEYYAYVLPSRFEAFPMVVLESISNGIPVIAFDLECGLKDMITSHENGILVERYDTEEMARQIISIYEDEKMRDKMSEKSLEKSKEFSGEKIIQKWIDLFEKRD